MKKEKQRPLKGYPSGKGEGGWLVVFHWSSGPKEGGNRQKTEMCVESGCGDAPPVIAQGRFFSSPFRLLLLFCCWLDCFRGELSYCNQYVRWSFCVLQWWRWRVSIVWRIEITCVCGQACVMMMSFAVCEGVKDLKMKRWTFCKSFLLLEPYLHLSLFYRICEWNFGSNESARPSWTFCFIWAIDLFYELVPYFLIFFDKRWFFKNFFYFI